jgi:hypothetical protein
MLPLVDTRPDFTSLVRSLALREDIRETRFTISMREP